MCLEATSFIYFYLLYLLEMVSEKITKLWQKREVAHGADTGTLFDSFHSLSLC